MANYNLVECRVCGKEISRNAQSCPNCGEPLVERIQIIKEDNGIGFWGVVLAIVVGLVIVSFC